MREVSKMAAPWPMLYPTIIAGYTAVVGTIATVYDKMRSRHENLNNSMGELKSTLLKEMMDYANAILQWKPIFCLALGMSMAGLFTQVLTYREMARYRKLSEDYLQRLEEKMDWLDTRVPRRQETPERLETPEPSYDSIS